MRSRGLGTGDLFDKVPGDVCPWGLGASLSLPGVAHTERTLYWVGGRSGQPWARWGWGCCSVHHMLFPPPPPGSGRSRSRHRRARALHLRADLRPFSLHCFCSGRHTTWTRFHLFWGCLGETSQASGPLPLQFRTVQSTVVFGKRFLERKPDPHSDFKSGSKSLTAARQPGAAVPRRARCCGPGTLAAPGGASGSGRGQGGVPSDHVV